MLISLHKQATTTPKIRAATQASMEPAWKVAERYGISGQTVWKWRNRDSVHDRSHTANRLQTTLTPVLAFKFTDAGLHLANGLVASDAVDFGHGDAAPVQHAFAPTIQQIGSPAIARRNVRNTLPVIHGRQENAPLGPLPTVLTFDDPQLVSRKPAPTATTVGDDLNLRHEHVLKAIRKPPWPGQGVLSKWGAVQAPDQVGLLIAKEVQSGRLFDEVAQALLMKNAAQRRKEFRAKMQTATAWISLH